MRTVRALPALLLIALALSGCAGEQAKAPGEPPYALPPVSGTFDYQLGTPYEIEGGLDVVARDSTESPAPGAYNICYVNGFQTQPGDSAEWLAERGHLLLRDADGGAVVDPDWPDEYILDPSSAEQRAGILGVMEPIIAGCAEAGFDAIEIDNLDTFTRFDGDSGAGAGAGGGAGGGAGAIGGSGIDEGGALELARAYVDAAHASGLAIGQKNSAELADRGRDELGFDFAVAEECSAFDECSVYADAYGEHVLQIEYADGAPGGFDSAEVDAICGGDERSPLTIIRDRDLVAPGQDGYFRAPC